MTEQNVHLQKPRKSKKTALDNYQENPVDSTIFNQEERDKSVYLYLLTCLTDLVPIKGSKGNEQPNESSIANQWGQKENRIFIRRVLRSVMPEHYLGEEIPPIPGLTLSKLLEILNSIQEYRSQKSLTAKDVNDLKNKPKILTREEKMRAIHKFSELSISERNKLGITVNSNEAIIQKLLEDITNPSKGLDGHSVARFCQMALNIYQSLRKSSLEKKIERSSWKSFIEEIVNELLNEYFPELSQLGHITKDLVEKVEREVNRIEFQCGINQVRSLLVDMMEIEKEKFDILSPAFVRHLTQSVVENEILTDEFPVYLKYIEVEKKQPLPLYIKENGDEAIGLLNPELLRFENNIDPTVSEGFAGLERQFVYKIKVHFYVHPPEDYNPRFSKEFKKQTSNSRSGNLNFYEEITGIGSPVTNILGAINRVLFWDIPALNAYMPIANEVLCYEEVVGQSSHSPVWCKTVVKLCKKNDVEQSIKENCLYEQVSSNNDLACGEYCGFDLLEVVSRSALIARLRAIKQTGIKPKQYLTELCQKIEELNIFRDAKRLLNFYPFSLMAMEGKLDATIFSEGRYRSRDVQFNFTEATPQKQWSLVAYDAHITIADGYLQEGLYQVGKKYLDILEPHLERKNLSDLEAAKYWLCRFRYHYLTDLDDVESIHTDRHQAVQNALESLEQAESHLKKRLHKYYKIGEFSQSNFHPFFYVLSRIIAFRAKVYMYTSAYADRPGNRWKTLLEPIRLLEQARIYAARDGSESYYAYWSAYQSWNYLILAYLGEFDRNLGITRDECFDWARRLKDHALLCYSSIGKECYQEIKDNGGKVTSIARPEPDLSNNREKCDIESPKYYEEYGSVQVQVIPLIRELPSNLPYGNKDQAYTAANHVLSIDMSILKQPSAISDDMIYLFGTHSSLLLFSMAMYDLCGEQIDESKLQLQIARALRTFTSCWAIAKDGTTSKSYDDSDRHFYLDRNFGEHEYDHNGDSLISGLYPHRLTDFADLGKIFAALCKAILLIQQSKQPQQPSQFSWEEIDNIIASLHDQDGTSSLNTRDVLEQVRYNGHLAVQFKNVTTYFEQMKQKRSHQVSSSSESLINIRDKLVKDVFRIMRGESDVKA